VFAIWRRAFRLSPAEWLDFVRAHAALVFASVAVRIRSRGQLLAYDGPSEAAELDPDLLNRAQSLALALDRASRLGILRPRCLVRSVALHRLLRQAGIPGSRIRIGVRPESQGLDAHAWVTLANRVLGDDPRFVGRFTEIADARLAGIS
jgi:hypothetical protein